MDVIRDDAGNCIGRNIRRLRIKKHVGQTELVRMLQLQGVNITREALVKIERGTQHIKVEQLRTIKEVLQVTYEELLEEQKEDGNGYL